MKVLCNKANKKIESFSRWDDLSHNPLTHVQVIINYIPDILNERLNNTEDGLRPVTQLELDADTDAELDQKADLANIDAVFKAYVLSINDGSIIPGSNMTGAALKAAIKAKL